MDYQNLYSQMIGCSKCQDLGQPGFLSESEYCVCYYEFVHQILCLQAGFNNEAITFSRSLDTKQLNLRNMVENKLGMVLVGNTLQCQSFICFQLWKNLNPFTRLKSTKKKFKIKYLNDFIPSSEDILCFNVRYTTEFKVKNQYEVLMGLDKAYFLMTDVPQDNSDVMEHGKNIASMLGLSSAFKIRKVNDIQIDPWSS